MEAPSSPLAGSSLLLTALLSKRWTKGESEENGSSVYGLGNAVIKTKLVKFKLTLFRFKSRAGTRTSHFDII